MGDFYVFLAAFGLVDGVWILVFGGVFVLYYYVLLRSLASWGSGFGLVGEENYTHIFFLCHLASSSRVL
jgi:hypothetical protein